VVDDVEHLPRIEVDEHRQVVDGMRVGVLIL
jgi:hypothetical protein